MAAHDAVSAEQDRQHRQTQAAGQQLPGPLAGHEAVQDGDEKNGRTDHTANHGGRHDDQGERVPLHAAVDTFRAVTKPGHGEVPHRNNDNAHAAATQEEVIDAKIKAHVTAQKTRMAGVSKDSMVSPTAAGAQGLRHRAFVAAIISSARAGFYCPEVQFVLPALWHWHFSEP